MKTFLLFVTYTAKDGMRENFVNELETSGAADLVRQEEGCLRYDYFYDAKNPNNVLLFEEWESKKHQEIHMTQPHIETIKAIKEKYIESVSLKIAE